MYPLWTPFREERKPEWILTVATIWLGFWYVLPMTTFTPVYEYAAVWGQVLRDLSPGWLQRIGDALPLPTWSPETWWGMAMVTVGSVNLCALIVNGARWWTPQLRLAALFLMAAAHGQLAFAVALVNPSSTLLAVLLGLLALVLWCIRRAAADAYLARARHDAGISA